MTDTALSALREAAILGIGLRNEPDAGWHLHAPPAG
jgi:hypothetical protein